MLIFENCYNEHFFILDTIKMNKTINITAIFIIQ